MGKEQFNAFAEEVRKGFGEMRERFDAIDKRFDITDIRIDRLEKKMDVGFATLLTGQNNIHADLTIQIDALARSTALGLKM